MRADPMVMKSMMVVRPVIVGTCCCSPAVLIVTMMKLRFSSCISESMFGVCIFTRIVYNC